MIGGADWADEAPERLGGRHGRLPRAIVEAGLVPAGQLRAGVVGLAEIDVVSADRAVGGLPGRVAGDRLVRAVGVVDLDLRDRPRPADGQIAPQVQHSPKRHRQRPVPSVAEHHAGGVLALLQGAGHVVGRV